MKKIFTVIFAVSLMAASVSAQGFRMGVTAGLEFSNMLEKDNDFTYSEDYKSKAGIKLGVVAEYSFNEYFAIAPELAFAQRGFKVEEQEDLGYGMGSIKMTATTNINYLQLPINAVVSYPVSDNFKVFALAGPYVGYALSGKVKTKLSGGLPGMSIGGDMDIEFGSGDEELKPLDFGLSFGAGAEFKGIFLKMQYNLGLSNLSNYTEDGYKLKNRNFGVSAGYMFSF